MKYSILISLVVAMAAAMAVRDLQDRPDALQGYFTTLMEIYQKLKQLGRFTFESSQIYPVELKLVRILLYFRTNSYILNGHEDDPADSYTC